MIALAKKNTTIAIGYARVSTTEQAQDGLSLDAQQARITAHAEANGMHLGGMYVDAGISGRKTSNRPALNDALNHVCREKGVLIVLSLSRLARSTKDAITISDRLGKTRAQLVSLSESIDTTTAAGRAFFGIISVLSEFESNQISERAKTAIDFNRRQQRRYCHHAPYGFKHEDGRIQPCSEEQRTIDRMRLLRTAGSTFRDIAATLSSEGVRNRSGAIFPHQHVRRILQRELRLRASA